MSRRRRIIVLLLAIAATAGIGGYVARDSLQDAIVFTFLFSGSRADWDLMQLRRKIGKGEVQQSNPSVRERCLEIAHDNPGTRAEAAAYLFVTKQWPDTTDADLAFEKLLQIAKTVDFGDWAHSLQELRPARQGEKLERWQPLAALLIDRVRQQPDHPQAARLLCEAAVLIHPDTDVESDPPELQHIAELIQENYATSPDLANFCEVVCNLGNPSSRSQQFEPPVRHILKVNQDRFVRCSAHFALASIVRSGGRERQEEARQLYEDFLASFDGETPYPAQSVEQQHCRDAERVLETIRLHGLGAPALDTVGIDLEGQPMSLADYRGKIVLLSFWATWCGPCMKAIPHERELLQHFGSDRFAIVGVNGDRSLDKAREAVTDHGMSWRSFQNRQDDRSSIADDWHIAGWPTFYLLDATGIIARSWLGLPSQSELRATIGELIDQVDGRQSAPLQPQ